MSIIVRITAALWFEVSYLCRHKWLIWLAIVHDLSKLRADEMVANIRADIEGGERCDYARLLHQKRNKHHWQWWVVIGDGGAVWPLEMPERYRREMLADWRSAGQMQGRPDTRQWYLDHRGGLLLAPQTRAWIERELGVTDGAR
jgi:hypothetical protein